MVREIGGSPVMKISYDKSTDTLYLFLGEQANSVARDVRNGMLVKYNKDTNKPVGAVIHDFESRFKKQDQPLEVPVFA